MLFMDCNRPFDDGKEPFLNTSRAPNRRTPGTQQGSTPSTSVPASKAAIGSSVALREIRAGLQPNTSQQVCEAGVRTERIEGRFHLEFAEHLCPLRIGF